MYSYAYGKFIQFLSDQRVLLLPTDKNIMTCNAKWVLSSWITAAKCTLCKHCLHFFQHVKRRCRASLCRYSINTFFLQSHTVSNIRLLVFSLTAIIICNKNHTWHLNRWHEYGFGFPVLQTCQDLKRWFLRNMDNGEGRVTIRS